MDDDIKGLISAIEAEKKLPPDKRDEKLLRQMAKHLIALQMPYPAKPCNDPPAHSHVSRSPSFGRWPAWDQV